MSRCPNCEAEMEVVGDGNGVHSHHCNTCKLAWPVKDRAIQADRVDHPPHYNAHPSGVECITVTEHMNFNLGNAIKYIWRAGLKSEDASTDLEKARWYVDREIARLKR